MAMSSAPSERLDCLVRSCRSAFTALAFRRKHLAGPRRPWPRDYSTHRQNLMFREGDSMARARRMTRRPTILRPLHSKLSIPRIIGCLNSIYNLVTLERFIIDGRAARKSAAAPGIQSHEAKACLEQRAEPDRFCSRRNDFHRIGEPCAVRTIEEYRCDFAGCRDADSWTVR